MGLVAYWTASLCLTLRISSHVLGIGGVSSIGISLKTWSGPVMTPGSNETFVENNYLELQNQSVIYTDYFNDSDSSLNVVHSNLSFNGRIPRHFFRKHTRRDVQSAGHNSDTDYLGDSKWFKLSHQMRVAALQREATNPEAEQNASLPLLHIGGLFELTTLTGKPNPRGISELEAAKLAIRHVNQQRFVPGYQLVLLHNDTKCDPGYGADAFYDFIYRKPQLVMLIGTSCSEVTKTLAEIVHYWNLLMVSHAAVSPALSDRERYPTFYRLAPADSSHNAARQKFIEHFGWNTVATIHEDDETFSLAMNEMNKDFDKVNINVKATLTFRTKGEDLHLQMELLKESDARIIIGSFQEDIAREVFCEAYHLGMYGPRYVWMLLGWYTRQWWTDGKTNCSVAELAQAVDGYFAVDSFNSIIGGGRSIAGLTTEEFLEAYEALNATSRRSVFTQLTYDSVWTVAYTLRNAMTMWKHPTLELNLTKYSYTDSQHMAYTFGKILGNLEFMGVSGPVSFDGPDRRGVTMLQQNQGGEQVRIGLYYPDNNTLDDRCPGCKTITWKGGRIPADKYTRVIREQHIHQEAFYIVCAISAVGIALAIFFLAFNLWHWRLKYIKLSSPKLNNVAVIGCILVYTAVIILGFDDITQEFEYFIVCSVRAYLLAAGFSLAFGAMFTKTYRVHQIFRGCHTGLVKSKLLRDKQLLFIIFALIVVDTLLMVLWVFIDPMERKISNFTEEVSTENTDLLYIPQLSQCHSGHIWVWMGVMYAYKGVLLLFGVYMAWETRHVKIPALNDSQYIGMNIYNVVLSSITVVALSNVLSDRPTLSYTVVSAFILLSTTGMLCLLFLPKIYAIVRHDGNPVITSSGLHMEANTRRFVLDEKRELHYRAEVQNRVYKREHLLLEQQIIRLERLLEMPLQPYSQITNELIYLLPESQEQNPPHTVREQRAEMEKCDSITDADDVATDLPEIDPSYLVEKQKLEKKDSGFHTMSFKNQNFKTVEEENAALKPPPGIDCDKQFPRGHSVDSALARSVTLGYTRRQSNSDGSHEERRSLLVDESETDVCSQWKQGTSCPNISTSGNATVFELQPIDTRWEVEGGACAKSPTELQGGNENKGTKSNISNKVKTRILKRELSKIQRELKALGEIEMDVSYV